MKTQHKTQNCLVVLITMILFMSIPIVVSASMTRQEMHEKMLYTVCRVNGGGSGTIVYSAENEDQTYSVYVLTNHHVVQDKITYSKEWDPFLEKETLRERRDTVYVEIFQYKQTSIDIGTFKVAADIVIYWKDGDLALLKLASESPVEYVATLLPRDAEYYIFDQTIAVGCSLAFPPLPTYGILTRRNYRINSLPYDMSQSQIIYGNSGGGMFLAETGELIGVPARITVMNWGTIPITHMGLFIPIFRVYEWLEREHFEFIFDATTTEADCLKLREEEIQKRREHE